MTKNPTSASREQTAEADFQRVRIGLYLQVLFLIHVGFLAVSAIQFMLGLDLPGASAQSAWEQAIMGLLTGGLGGG